MYGDRKDALVPVHPPSRRTCRQRVKRQAEQQIQSELLAYLDYEADTELVDLYYEAYHKTEKAP